MGKFGKMRVVAILMVILVGIGIDIWLADEHRFAPILVFVLMIALIGAILRKLPKSAWETRWIANRGQKKIAVSIRRSVYISMIGSLLGIIVFFASGLYKALPLWLTLFIVVFALFVNLIYPLWL